MKTFNYILVLIFLSSCSTAQNFKLIEAFHTINIGGVKGARSEKFDLTVKNNPQLIVKHLLVGNVVIELTRKESSGLLHLSGLYFPEQQEMVSADGKILVPENRDNFNLEHVFLVSEYRKTGKQIAQKIKFAKNPENTLASPDEDVPE